MSTNNQIPFDAVEFATNPEPRCPCVLVLDTSASMQGVKIDELNAGLRSFEVALKADATAAKRVEVAIVGFGPVRVLQPFVTADALQCPALIANGDTPLGAAVAEAVRLVEERKESYKRNGVGYYRPWIFVITDGAATDDLTGVAVKVREDEAAKRYMFYAVGVDGADMRQLERVAVRAPLMLRGLEFGALFQWLSDSLGRVSQSKMGDPPARLDNPTTPTGWAVAD